VIVGRASELAQFAPDSFRTVTLLGNEHVRVLTQAGVTPGKEPTKKPEGGA
jgi:hypothetical protein